MNAAVIGASGYSGEELVRLLERHPDVTLAAVTSRSLAGKPVADVMPGLRHLVGDLEFSNSDPAELAARDCGAALESFERALVLRPDSGEIYQALSRSYATCPAIESFASGS